MKSSERRVMKKSMDSYNKIGWVNGSEPALSAENLNHMDDGIEAATEAITSLQNELPSLARLRDIPEVPDVSNKANKMGVGTQNLILFSTNDGDIKRSEYNISPNKSAIKTSATRTIPTGSAIAQAINDIEAGISSQITDDRIYEIIDEMFSDPGYPCSGISVEAIQESQGADSVHWLTYIDSNSNRHLIFNLDEWIERNLSNIKSVFNTFQEGQGTLTCQDNTWNAPATYKYQRWGEFVTIQVRVNLISKNPIEYRTDPNTGDYILDGEGNRIIDYPQFINLQFKGLPYYAGDLVSVATPLYPSGNIIGASVAEDTLVISDLVWRDSNVFNNHLDFSISYKIGGVL